jgi:catechol 2,3-dioxygenase-like lactoylglutathione lyase family enzyme
MFDAIQHIGYWSDDLEKTVAWFQTAFGAEHSGGGPMPSSRIVPGGGRNAFVRFGGVEAELMQPADTSALPKNTLVMHHVGYVVADMPKAVEQAKARGLRFLGDTPNTNVMGQQVLYFDPDCTNGVWMHLTKVPVRDTSGRGNPGPRIDGIVHPGYLVRDLDAATAWYVEKLGGVHVGGGPSRRGGRVAFVNCGSAQIELIEPQDPTTVGRTPVLDHVGYLTRSLDADLPAYIGRGLRFATDAPAVNPIGQELIYFDTDTSMGSRMHLTEVPA